MSAKSAMVALACAAAVAAPCARAEAGSTTPVAEPSGAPQAPRAAPHAKPRLDTSGRTRVGKASIYARKLRGREMADGTPMSLQSDSAASKTLPLGTTAKVTNLETGESAVVTIRDRGPYVKGRIVDLSPATAAQVGLDRRQGISKVEVAPISVPPTDAGTPAPAAPPDSGRTHPAKPREESTRPADEAALPPRRHPAVAPAPDASSPKRTAGAR